MGGCRDLVSAFLRRVSVHREFPFQGTFRTPPVFCGRAGSFHGLDGLDLLFSVSAAVLLHMDRRIVKHRQPHGMVDQSGEPHLVHLFPDHTDYSSQNTGVGKPSGASGFLSPPFDRPAIELLSLASCFNRLACRRKPERREEKSRMFGIDLGSCYQPLDLDHKAALFCRSGGISHPDPILQVVHQTRLIFEAEIRYFPAGLQFDGSAADFRFFAQGRALGRIPCERDFAAGL